MESIFKIGAVVGCLIVFVWALDPIRGQRLTRGDKLVTTGMSSLIGLTGLYIALSDWRMSAVAIVAALIFSTTLFVMNRVMDAEWKVPKRRGKK